MKGGEIMEVAPVISPNLSTTTDKKAVAVYEGDFSEQLMKYSEVQVKEASQQTEAETSSQENSLSTEEEELTSLEKDTEEELERFALINPFISFDVQTDNQMAKDSVNFGITDISDMSRTSNPTVSMELSDISEANIEMAESVGKVNDHSHSNEEATDAKPLEKTLLKPEIELKQSGAIESEQANTQILSPDKAIEGEPSLQTADVNSEAANNTTNNMTVNENSKEIVPKTLEQLVKPEDEATIVKESPAVPLTESEPIVELYTYQRNLSQIIPHVNPDEQAIDNGTLPTVGDEEESIRLLSGMRPNDTQVTVPKAAIESPTGSQPPVTLADSMDQIEELIINKVQNDKGTEVIQSTIRLTPESLGEIEIELIIDKEDVSGKFIFKSEEAKRYVESQLTQLRTPLEAKGIKFNSIEMTVKEQPQGQSQEMTFSQNFNQSKGEKQVASYPEQGHHEEATESHAEPLLRQTYTRESGLNVYA